MLTQTSLCSLLLSLDTLNDAQSVYEHSENNQATNKGSGQTARMCRLILGLAGRKYHIVGNLMSGLKLFSYFSTQSKYMLWVRNGTVSMR